ncbi:MAG TPA: histidine kinase [Gemmatirosa sp.]
MPPPTTAPTDSTERHRLTRREVGVAALVWGGYGVLGWASWLFDHHWVTATTIVEQLVGATVESACWFGLTFPILALAERWARGEGSRAARVVIGAVVAAPLMGTAHLLVRDMAHVPAARLAAAGPALVRAIPTGPVGARGGVVAAVPDGYVQRVDGEIVLRGASVQSGEGQPPDGRPTGPFWLGMLNALALYLAVFGAGLSRAYARQAQLRRDEGARREALLHAQREEAARREATLQMQLAEARLDALRRQLDPHFLFNTLNAVSALVVRDPSGVRSMIARLSELLRFSFEGAERAEIPLREELALLDRYVEIMEVRFQGRLVVDRRVDAPVLDALVPTMVLQPLVENAIRHGVERRKGTGHVVVEACADGDTVMLRVTDDGPGPGAAGDEPRTIEPRRTSTPADASGTARRGIGVANTVARLAHLYSDAASFTLTRGPDGGAVAEVRLPRRAVAAAAVAAVA